MSSSRARPEREGFAAPLAQATYRVVQEALTNALRYASGAPVSVLVRGGPAELFIEVVNGPAGRVAELAGAGTGNGLRGLRELADDCGGTLQAGPLPDGGWRVATRLPRRAVRAPG